MKLLQPFRGRVLESVLIITAVAVAVAAVTVVANLLSFNARFEQVTGEGLYSRQIVLKPKAEDYDAFYQSAVPADVREVGPKGARRPSSR